MRPMKLDAREQVACDPGEQDRGGAEQDEREPQLHVT